MKKSLQMGSFCTMFFLTAYVFQFILINQSQVATLLKLRVANSAFAVILDDCLTDPWRMPQKIRRLQNIL